MSIQKKAREILPPTLTNNPSWDVIVTSLDPLLSFFNAKGGPKEKKYELEIDTSKNFKSAKRLIYKNIKEQHPFVTGFKIPKTDALDDDCVYYWRVRTVTAKGKSDWAVSRFSVDIESDATFMNLTRAKVKSIKVSDGYNSKNITDWDDPGLETFWQSPPPGAKYQWIRFDLGKPKEVSRAWIMSNIKDVSGWLKEFVLEKSNDGNKWTPIKKSAVKNNETFRNIVDFPVVKARYFRLVIKFFTGFAAQVNEVILFSPGKPKTPKVPKKDYVLVIGNEHNGFTFTDLAEYIESLSFGLATVSVPYYEVSMEMIGKLSRKPVAIVLSGNNADYPNLPMFEYAGEFEMIRKTDIPLLGICAGHQFLAMAYGYTKARSMGWSDISFMKPVERLTRVKVRKQDPIFAGMKDDFTAPEIHSWAVVEPAEEFAILASSTYVQVQKSTRRFIYGTQFHPEIKTAHNHGKKLLENFLKMALAERKKSKRS